LSAQCAHYLSKFGKLPKSETPEVLNSETMNDMEAQWIAEGREMVVAVLGVLEQVHPKHQRTFMWCDPGSSAFADRCRRDSESFARVSW